MKTFQGTIRDPYMSIQSVSRRGILQVSGHPYCLHKCLSCDIIHQRVNTTVSHPPPLSTRLRTLSVSNGKVGSDTCVCPYL